MKEDRRARLKGIVDGLGEYMNELESMADDERDEFNGMPEGTQGSAEGQEHFAAAEAMFHSASELDNLIVGLQECFGLREAEDE